MAKKDLGFIKNRLVGWSFLLAEDNDDAMHIAERWLNLAEAAVLMATDGKQALEVARAEVPSVIITDLHMPEMDGWQLCNAIRADDKLKKTPVIA